MCDEAGGTAAYVIDCRSIASSERSHTVRAVFDDVGSLAEFLARYARYKALEKVGDREESGDGGEKQDGVESTA